MPDTVKSMAWCGENICLGIRREYMILNTTNGAMSEVFPSGRTAPPLVVSLPSGELLLGKVILVVITSFDTLWFFISSLHIYGCLVYRFPKYLLHISITHQTWAEIKEEEVQEMVIH